MRFNAVASMNLNALSTVSRSKELDNWLLLLNACTDDTCFPAKDSRDIFFHARDNECQLLLKFSNEYEELSFEEAVEIYKTFETN